MPAFRRIPAPPIIWLATGFSAVYLAAFFSFLVLRPVTNPELATIDNWATLLGPFVVIAAFTGIAFRQSRLAGEHVTAWHQQHTAAFLLILGVVTDTAGQALWTYYVQVAHWSVPYPSGADVAYLCTYPLWLMAILNLPRVRTSLANQTRLTIDGLVVMAAAFTFSWYFLLGPTLFHDHGPVLAKAVGVAYPLGDLMLLGCLVLIFTRGDLQRMGRVAGLLVAGLLAVIAADSYFTFHVLRGSYVAGTPIDILWPAGDILVGVAALLLLTQDPTSDFALPNDQVATAPPRSLLERIVGSALPYGLVPLVGILLAATTLDHYDHRYVPGVVIGSLVLISLVLTRQFIAIVENARLSTELEHKVTELATVNDRLVELAGSDALTGLPNHRSMLTILEQEVDRAERYGHSMAVLFLDLDRFKNVNDSFGHRGGDLALREVAAAARSVVRNVDFIGRWGGEEFVAVLPETEQEGATLVAERIRTTLAQQHFAIAPDVRVTCSIGVAVFPQDAQAAEDLVALADEAMYAAKWLGRNQVRAIGDATVQMVVEERTSENKRDEAAISATVEALASLVDVRDHYTGTHAVVVASLCRRMAGIIGLSWEEVALIDLAGRLHDIGKVAIPDAILLKRGPLTETEWAQMRTHPSVGADVVGWIPKLRALAPIVRAHHERWDGTGYPDRLKGDAIPIGARIITVADSYAAMTSDRPYRKAMSEFEALQEILRCSGTQFDPEVVEALERLVAGPAAIWKAG